MMNSAYFRNKAWEQLTPQWGTAVLFTLVYLLISFAVSSVAECVPLIGVIYDPKIKGFLDYIKQDMLIDAENIDSSLLRELIEKILNNKDEIKENLITYKEELSKKALSNAEMTINLLEQS